MKLYINFHRLDNRNNRDCGFIEGRIRSLISNTYRLYKLFYRKEPYFTPSANSFLKKYLNKEMITFEWGSGASTLWIAQRVKYNKFLGLVNNWEIRHFNYGYMRTSVLIKNK